MPAGGIRTDRVTALRTDNGQAQPARLWNRNFILLLQGRAVSQMGNAIAQVAILFWVLEATRSATAMGMVAMVGSVPAVFLGVLGGVYADRLNKKWTIVVCDALVGVALLGAGAAFYLYAENTLILLATLAVANFVIGCVSALFFPALQATVPIVVPHPKLHQANSMFGAVAAMTQVLGQALGGMLYRILGAPLLIVLNGVAFVASAISEMLLRLPPEQRRPVDDVTPARTVRHDLMDGLRYILHHRGLRSFYLLYTIWYFLNAPNIILLPILVDEYLGATPDWLGYILASLGVGGVLGSFALASLHVDGRARLVWFTGSGVVVGLGLVFLGYAPSPLWAVAIAFSVGLFIPVINIVSATIVQATTPGHMIGRVSSIGSTIMAVSLPVGYVFWGVVIDATGRDAPLLMAICGAGTVLNVLGFAVLGRSYRQFLTTRTSAAMAH